MPEVLGPNIKQKVLFPFQGVLPSYQGDKEK